MALDLNSAQGQNFGPAGANHAPGLVPDPGSTTNSPVRILGDDAAFHTQASLLPGVLPTPTRAGDLIYWNGSAWVTLAGNNSGTANLQETSAGVPSWVVPTAFTVPTVQRFTSGSAATYTPAAGILYIRVRMCAGGGGGGGTSGNNGGTGGNTSFASWTCVGGNGGTGLTSAPGNPGGTGGSGGTNSTGTLIDRFSGGCGGNGVGNSANLAGMGGSNPFGGSGLGGVNVTSPTAGAANTGAGGGGLGTSNSFGAGGGGAGEYVEFIMSAAQVGVSQTYTVGTAGSAGTGGGAAGAAGVITVIEFYQ